MSDYFESLSGDVRVRYLNKINLIQDVDPYNCDLTSFSRQLEHFPQILHGDIFQYLVLTKSFYTHQELKAFKSLEAYKYVSCGWVRDLLVKKFKENILIFGKVMHSQRLNEKPLQPWIIARPDGEILCGHCTCAAGLGEACTHLAAILFAVEDAKLREEKVSVTGVKAAWKVPQGKVGAVGQWGEVSRHMRIIQSHKISTPTEEDIFELLSATRDAGITSPEHMYKTPFSIEIREKIAERDIPNPLLNLFSESCYAWSLDELRKMSADFDFSITTEEIQVIEEETRGQSENKLWFKHRTGRITASNFKKACITDPQNPAISTVKAVCYPKKLSFKQTNYGCKHEKDALEAYIKSNSSRHINFSCTQVGFILSLEYPNFGASPDAIITCECCGEGCVEIKCPYCKKDQIFHDDLPSYLKKKQDGIFLLTNHAYYYQIQMQMQICKKLFCDFIVWSSKELYVERIHFDAEFWQKESVRAHYFWRQVILPELFGKYYTRMAQQTVRADNEASTSAAIPQATA